MVDGASRSALQPAPSRTLDLPGWRAESCSPACGIATGLSEINFRALVASVQSESQFVHASPVSMDPTVSEHMDFIPVAVLRPNARSLALMAASANQQLDRRKGRLGSPLSFSRARSLSPPLTPSCLTYPPLLCRCSPARFATALALAAIRFASVAKRMVNELDWGRAWDVTRRPTSCPRSARSPSEARVVGPRAHA
jgi:hypothetical protein